MNPLEWIADRMPAGLLRSVATGATLGAIIGSACVLAATVYGSIVWAVAGVVSFTVAAVLWHVATIGAEARDLRPGI